MYKISDWGLSKLKIDASVTLSGATPSYAAPEQISQEFGKADERTDIYQLGNVFYELLTGRLPFEGDISQIYSSILTTKPPSPADLARSRRDPGQDRRGLEVHLRTVAPPPARPLEVRIHPSPQFADESIAPVEFQLG